MNGCVKTDGNAVSFFNFSPIRSLFLSGALCGLPACAWASAEAAAPAPASSPTLLSGWRPFAEAQVWAAYDGATVVNWSSGISPKDGRNVMLQRNRAEIGMENDQWRIGWEVRQDATIVSNSQTLEFIRLYQQRLKPSGPTTNSLDARFNVWSARGPRVGRWFGPAASGGWIPRVNLSGAIYTNAVVREGDVSGTVNYVPTDQYDFNVRGTDANSRYRYPFMQQAPEGSGASVAMAMEWRPSDALRLGLKIDDLWSTMRWRNLPLTENHLDSRVTQYDQQGYVNYRPLLNGTNQQVSRNSALPRSGVATVSYDFGPLGVATDIERIAGVTIPTLALAHQFGWGKLTTSFETRFRTFGVGIDTQGLHLALQADSLSLGKAKALGMSVGVRY